MTNKKELETDRLAQLQRRRDAGAESQRVDSVAKRKAKGWSTARETLAHLVDADSVVEYGELAVAAQRGRRDHEDLVANTTGDGVITALATINADRFGEQQSRVGVIVNDYTVLAATQGFYHHKKIDRLLDVATRDGLPVVMFAEGGGGRPGDTDVTTQVTGLDVPTFARWARLQGKGIRIAVANGYCFAGNALLFGCADLRIATETSWIGMAGPAMIEAGGLGSFKPTDIGPAAMHYEQGTVDVIVADDVAACELTQQLLGYFQGEHSDFTVAEQATLRSVLPQDRRFTYKLRPAIACLVDQDSFVEIGAGHGKAMVTGFARVAGKPVGLIANDNQQNAGAIDTTAAKKAARLLRLCGEHNLSVLSLIDTPGFMVGPDSEAQGALDGMSEMFTAAATFRPPMIAIVLRKAYGLGAMAMAGGGFDEPHACVAWPNGEFGAMGLEGAVRLGFRKELDAAENERARSVLFETLVQQLYERGSAIEAASMLEIDAVIDPAETRNVIHRLLG
ncbi:MAG: carboxyl transferase domain-containing protein [Pseudomonadota bacterium]